MLKNAGFTLIELLIVIVIIAILAVVGITLFNNVQSSAHDARRKADIQAIAQAMEAHYNPTSGAYPTALDATWFADGAIPTDPDGEPYPIIVGIDPDGSTPVNGFIVCTSSEVGSSCSESSQIKYDGPPIIISATPTPTPTSNPTSTPTPTPTPTPQVKYVFVSSATGTGNLDGLIGADNSCTSLADASIVPGIPGKTWKAWLSDGVNSPSTRFTNTPEYRNTGAVVFKLVDGTTTVAADWPGLISGADLSNLINKNQNGTVISTTPQVWTNTTTLGTIASAFNCTDWTSSLSSASGRRGNLQQISASWTDTGSNSTCDLSFRVYCFEQ